MPRAPWCSFFKKTRIQPLLKSSSHKQPLVGALAFSHFSTEQGGGGWGQSKKIKKKIVQYPTPQGRFPVLWCCFQWGRRQSLGILTHVSSALARHKQTSYYVIYFIWPGTCLSQTNILNKFNTSTGCWHKGSLLIPTYLCMIYVQGVF